MSRNAKIRKYTFHFLRLPVFSWENRLEIIVPPKEIRHEKTEPQKAGKNEYLCDSMFLSSCYERLIKGPDEELYLVTGTQYNNTKILTTMLPLKYKYQSIAGVAGDEESTRQQLKMVDAFGSRYLAYFHSHPGYGEDATRPSTIDISLQQKYERAKQFVIGGIFSRSGHVRFYSYEFPFTINVLGKRVRKVSDNVFQLEIQSENVPVQKA